MSWLSAENLWSGMPDMLRCYCSDKCRLCLCSSCTGLFEKMQCCSMMALAGLYLACVLPADYMLLPC